VTDYYELLAVPRSASTAEIRKAYARLAKDRHPDRFPDPAQREEAQRFFMEITAAFNTLSNEKSRQEYDAALARPRPTDPAAMALEAYEAGMKVSEANAYFQAVELLRQAVYLAPAEARYRSALGTLLARNREWIHDAVQELEEAIRLDHGSAAYRGQLAEVLLGQGLRLRARKTAEAAIALDPNERRARRVLAETAAGEEGGRSGGR
jgi:curved DNA-binding protein CbpA